jgi:predicted nucleotidyltransferase
VVLYGSRAKGNYRPCSDIELTVFGELDLSCLYKIEVEIDDLLLRYKMDIFLHHQIINPDLLEHINRIGFDFYSPVLK